MRKMESAPTQESIPLTKKCVVVKKDAAFGTSAFVSSEKSSAGFAPGDVVLCEPPSLVIPDPAAPTTSATYREAFTRVMAICRENAISATHFEAVLAAEATLRSSAELSAIIADLYSPTGEKVVQPSRGEVAATAALLRADCFDELCRLLRPDSSGVGIWRGFLKGLSSDEERATTVINFVHAVRVNTHADNRRGFQGVFPTASKFAHSCAANTYWFLREQPTAGQYVVVHVALRRIEPGELLTFGYQGSGLNCVAHTLQRRHSLLELNFTCLCKRCAVFDSDAGERVRQLLCPVCETAGAKKRGVVTLRSSSHGGWYCDGCESVLKPAAVAALLRKEKEIVSFMMFLFFGSATISEDGESAPMSEEARQRRRQEQKTVLMDTETGQHCAAAGDGLSVRWTLAVEWIPERLGPDHYASVVATHSIVRCFLIAMAQQREAGNSDLIPFIHRQQQQQQQLGEGGVEGGGGTAGGVVMWMSALFRRIVAAQKWFLSEMPCTAQHLAFLLMVAEFTAQLFEDRLEQLFVYTVLRRREQEGNEAPSSSPKRAVFAIEAASEDAIAQQKQQRELLRRFCLSAAVPAVMPFWARGYAEFAPMTIPLNVMLRDVVPEVFGK